MKIEKTVNGNDATLKIEGWMDTQGAPMLGQALGELGAEVKHLVLDLGGLEYVSSAGILNAEDMEAAAEFVKRF